MLRKCRHRKIWQITSWTTAHLDNVACTEVSFFHNKIFSGSSSAKGLEWCRECGAIRFMDTSNRWLYPE